MVFVALKTKRPLEDEEGIQVTFNTPVINRAKTYIYHCQLISVFSFSINQPIAYDMEQDVNMCSCNLSCTLLMLRLIWFKCLFSKQEVVCSDPNQ